MGAAPSHEPRRFARYERAAPDEIVVRILTYADDRTLRAAEVNKRWSRLARTREPWRSALHFARLCRRREWRATTPQDVLLNLEIMTNNNVVVLSATIPADALVRESAAAGLKEWEYRLPRAALEPNVASGVSFEDVTAQLRAAHAKNEPLQARALELYAGGAKPWDEAEAEAVAELGAPGPEGWPEPDFAATLRFVRVHDLAVFSQPLSTEYNSAHGQATLWLEFESAIYPRDALHSYMRRAVMKHNDTTPGGWNNMLSTTELSVEILFPADGRRIDVTSSSYEPGDIAIIFYKNRYPYFYEHEDEFEPALEGGHTSVKTTLDAELLGALEWEH